MGRLSPTAKYILLPGIIPRLRTFFTQGFTALTWVTVLVFASVRLLPNGHPYLNAANAGKFGIRHVIAEAANNLELSRQNIDQILVFGLIVCGMSMIVIQAILFVMAVIAGQPAVAQTIQDLFLVSSQYGHGDGIVNGGSESQDLTFILFDRIFGTQNIFNSCISTAYDCLDMNGNPVTKPAIYPFPLHQALHALLEFYAYGIFFIAVFIIIYFVITIVGETAVTGMPFGQRLNKGWAPIRLIMFFGLLVPLNTGGNTDGFASGLNSAQFITFWTAKFGSSFATNAWGRFNENITDTYLNEKEKLIATPQIPEMHEVLQFMFIVHTCKAAHAVTNGTVGADNGPNGGIKGYVVRAPAAQLFKKAGVEDLDDALVFADTNYDDALAHAAGGNITIRFGIKNDSDNAGDIFKNSWGGVAPYCGDIQIPITVLDKDGAQKSAGSLVQESYYDLVKDIWQGNGIQSMAPYAQCLAYSTMAQNVDPSCNKNDWYPRLFFVQTYLDAWNNDIAPTLRAHVQEQINRGDFTVSENLRRKGWAGAALWYNRLAKMNGEVTGAISNSPRRVQWPLVMEDVMRSKMQENANLDASTIFEPFLAEGTAKIKFSGSYANDLEIARALNAAYKVWMQDNALKGSSTSQSDNIFINFVNAIFGTRGIYTIRDNTDIHPLAQLSALGKGIMEASVRNLAIGMGSSTLQLVAKGPLTGMMDSIVGGPLKSLGAMTLMMGFILFYVLPFMPFLYFFFALGGWVKSIFEAIVAMPLWALSFLAIDGDGLWGRNSTNGIFLLFEIFLRPVLILFGLIAGITIFTSLVHVLNDIFDTVVNNVSGFNMETGQSNDTDPNSLTDTLRNPVDEFFFTAMYTMLVYLIGQSTFKLIDTIPDKILRWMHYTGATFQEDNKNMAGTVSSMSYKGGTLLGGQISGGQLAFL